MFSNGSQGWNERPNYQSWLGDDGQNWNSNKWGRNQRVDGMFEQPISLRPDNFNPMPMSQPSMPSQPQSYGSQTGGYDSSGINPGGMFTGGNQQPQMWGQPGLMQPGMPTQPFQQQRPPQMGQQFNGLRGLMGGRFSGYGQR